MGFFKKILTGAGTVLDIADLWGDKAKAKTNAADQQLQAAAAATEKARQLAANQAAETAAAQKAHEDSLRNIAENAAKLTDANNADANMGAVSNVVAGGTADAVSPLKKKRVSLLSSSLGINI